MQGLFLDTQVGHAVNLTASMSQPESRLVAALLLNLPPILPPRIELLGFLTTQVFKPLLESRLLAHVKHIVHHRVHWLEQVSCVDELQSDVNIKVRTLDGIRGLRVGGSR
jgi:hypothetical protein